LQKPVKQNEYIRCNKLQYTLETQMKM